MTHQLRTYLYVLSLAIISLFPTTAAAQDNGIAEPQESDSIQFFRGMSVSYDVAGTVMRMVGDYGQYEAALRINLRDRYFPIVELGLGSASHSTDIVTGIKAKTNAPYGRIGCDLNIAKNKHDDYRVMVGARYGFTFFKQEASGYITDPYWGGQLPYSTSINSNFHWAELLFSVDAKLWGPVRLGWSVRYRMKLHGRDDEETKLWYIPGFGKNGNVLGGTFNVSFELGRKNRKIKE